MSADGRRLYVPSRGSDSLLVFGRDSSSGVLTESACFRVTAQAGCTTTNSQPLVDATGAALSADGKSLYVVGGGGGISGIIHFTLDCERDAILRQAALPPAARAPRLRPWPNAATVAVSPDDKSVYVASYNSHAITVFNRNTTTGSLNQIGLTNAQRCIKREASEGCTVNALIETPRDIEVTPDGKQVLTVNAECQTIVVASTSSRWIATPRRGAHAARWARAASRHRSRSRVASSGTRFTTDRTSSPSRRTVVASSRRLATAAASTTRYG